MPRAKLNPTDERVRQMLEHLYARKIVASRLVIGDVELDFTDTRLSAKLASGRAKGAQEPTAQGLFHEYAGGLLDEIGLQESPGATAIENMQSAEEDEEP